MEKWIACMMFQFKSVDKYFAQEISGKGEKVIKKLSDTGKMFIF